MSPQTADYPTDQTEPDIDDPMAADTPEEPPIIVPEAADNEQECVTRLRTIYDKYRQHPARLEAEQNWKKHYYAYRCVKAYPDQYKVPEIFRQVETLIPQVDKVLLDAEEKFTFQARQEGFDEDAEGTTAIVHDQLQRYGSIEQLYMAVDFHIKFGKAYVMPSWRKFKQTRYKMTPMVAEGSTDEWDRETSEVPMDAPYLEFVPAWEVYADPTIEEARNSPMVVRRLGASVDDLKTLVREGYLDADATQRAIEDGDNNGTDDNNWRWQGGINGYADQRSLIGDAEAYFELLQFWQSDGMHFVVLGEHLLHAAPTQDGEIPIVDFTNYPQAREHFGISEIANLFEGQRIIDDLMGMFIKQHYFDLPRLQGAKANQDAWNLSTVKPGGVIYLKDYTQPFTPIPTTGSSGTGNLANGINTMLQYGKEATGISDELAGTASNTGTATGIVKLQAAAGDRIQHKIARLIPAFKRIYAWLYNLNARYLQTPYRLRIQGKDGLIEHKMFTPEIFQPDIDVDIEIGGGTGAEQGNLLLNFYKVAGQDPLVNRGEILKEMFKASGLARPKRFITSNQNQQSNAVDEFNGLMMTGVLADPKPTDDHQTHLQINSMQLQQMMQMGAPPDQIARMQNHVAIHQSYVQQMMQANAQAQQAQMQQGQQAQGIGQQANARTEGMFQNGQRGAAQMGAA